MAGQQDAIMDREGPESTISWGHGQVRVRADQVLDDRLHTPTVYLITNK
jgi:hypothetical protein